LKLFIYASSPLSKKVLRVMKKAILFFALSFFFCLGVAQAQSCQGAAASAPKSCCASKAAAAKAAAADPTIEKRMADDGTVSYVRKETDNQGNVRFVSVRFDEETKTFVNVAPPTAPAEGMTKKSCSTAEAKACAGSGGAKACAGKAEGKSCCASKKAAVEQK
jgi:hypothetical protein